MQPIQTLAPSTLTSALSYHPLHPNIISLSSAQESFVPLPSCSQYSAAQYTKGTASLMSLTCAGCCCSTVHALTPGTCAARRRCTTYVVRDCQLSNQIHNINFFVHHSFIAASSVPWILTDMTAGPLMNDSTQTAMCSMAGMIIRMSQQQGVQPLLVDAQDRFGSVPLMTAITMNVMAAARLLCESGANPNIEGAVLVVSSSYCGSVFRGLKLSFS